MNKSESDIQKENRIRWARLIEKQSELSSRQHALSEKKLIHTKLKEENKKKKEKMKKCQAQVDNYQSQIDLVKKEILTVKVNLKAITTQMSQANLPDLDLLRASISKRKKNINDIQDEIRNLKNEDKNLDSQKQNLVKLIDSKQKSLILFTSREEKILQTLQVPIDDLRLEEITVNKLEQFISQLNNNFNANESFSDSSNVNEELLVKKIEEENQNKKKRINQIKERIEFLRSQPPTPKSQKSSTTPTKRLDKPNAVKYDENRLLRFNSTINSFKERQKMIDQLENTTLNVQIAWANDQKQIEDSWMGKMDDMQVLQKKVDEIENLIFDIEEYSEKIHQLREEESLLNEKKSECEKSKSKIELKLYEISECHNCMQKQVDDYVKKKDKIDKAAEILKKKKKNLLVLQNEIKQLDNLYQQYRIKVKAIENKVDEIKSSLSNTRNQGKIPEQLDHVKFSDYRIPKLNNSNNFSKEGVTNNINTSPQPNKKEEKLTTPNRKEKKFGNDNLSDSTFSMRDLEKESITSSLIKDNLNNYYNNDKNCSFNCNNYSSIASISPNNSNNYDSIDSYIKNSNSIINGRNSIKNNQNSFCISNKNDQNEEYDSFNSDNGKRSNISYSIEKKKDPVNKKSTKEKELNNHDEKKNSDNQASTKERKNDLDTSNKENGKISQRKSSSIQSSSDKSNERKSGINVTNNSITGKKSGAYGSSNSKRSNNDHIDVIRSTSRNESSIDLSNSENNQDSQRSEIEIEFSDNENTKSVNQSIIKNLSMAKSEMKFSTPSKYSHISKDSKLDSMKKIIKDEQEEEHILSKIHSLTNENNLNKDDHSSDSASFNPKEYEAILNCTESSRSAFISNNNKSIKKNDDVNYSSNHPNDSTFKSIELEDEIIEEEEEQNSFKEDKKENHQADSLNKIQEEEEEEIDVFDNVSTSYRVDSNPIFPTPELFSDKNSNVYEYSKEEISDVEAASASIAAISNDENELQTQTTEFKNFFSESTQSQITPVKKPIHPSKIDIDVVDIETPKASRYERNRIAQINDESDEEFNNLVKEAQNAIELPLLKSRYQSP